MCAYDAKYSDCQIQISPILTESRFAKFNARQTYLLYSIQFSVQAIEAVLPYTCNKRE